MKQVNISPFTAAGSNVEAKVDPAKWADADGFAQYMVEYAANVILQRASAGKNDDSEKAEKAVKAAVERLISGEVPSGGGFSRLSDEDYAMKEALTASKVKFLQGESVTQCLERLATKLADLPEIPEGDTHEDLMEAGGAYADEYAAAIEATATALRGELESTEIYKAALKLRKSKGKVKQTGLLGKLK